MLNKFKDEEILNLPIMTDEVTLLATNIMSLLAFYSSPVGNEGLGFLCQMNIIQLSLTKGLSRTATATALAMFGTLERVLGSIDTAVSRAHLAVALHEKIGDILSESKVLVACHACIFHNREPAQNSIPECFRAFKVGFNCGDISWGVFALANYCLLKYRTGSPLEQLFREMMQYRERLIRLYNKDKILSWVYPCLQSVQCLLGETKRTIRWC